MNILIPTASTMDVYMVRAAQEMGHTVHQLCMQDGWRVGSIREACGADHFHTMPSRFEAGLDRTSYKEMHREMMYTISDDYDIEMLLPTSSLDFSMDDIADVNYQYGYPGIRPTHAEMFRDKTNYLPFLASMGINVPAIYEIVEPNGRPTRDDFPYPVIAKPGYGTGGFGVCVVDSPEKLNWMFSASDNPNGFSERAMFNQDLDENGNPFCYVHSGFGGRYMIQEYMEGPCISLVGTAKRGKLELELYYDINVTEAPYCSEISFGWPSNVPGLYREAERLTALLGTNLRFPDGAWMADTIYKDGQLYLIDLSCRASSSGTKILYHVCDDRLIYPKKVIECQRGDILTSFVMPGREAFYSYIPFPKGRITDIKYPEADNPAIVEVIRQLGGEGHTSEMRNDVQVVDRGCVVAESDTRETAERAVVGFINAIQYKTS